MNKTAVTILAIIVIILAGWWLVKSKATAPTTTEITSTTESTSTTTSNQTVSVEPETVTISGSEFRYEPAIITAKVGQPVTVVYKNIGQYPHDFVIDELGVKSQTIKSGQTETFSFTPNKAGTFSFYCSLPNHRDKGMVGTLSVQ